jgi:hypothetical protein
VELLPTSLIPGYGDKVCSFLLALANHVMELEDFKFKAPIHHDDSDPRTNGQQDNDANDDVIEEENADGSGDRRDEAQVDDLSHSQSHHNLSEETYHRLVHASIDPVLWLEEFERVSPLLANHSKNSSSRNYASSQEWLLHITEISKYKATIINSRDDKDNSLLTSLHGLGKDLQAALGSVKRSEGMLNHLDAMTSRIQEYSTLHQVCIVFLCSTLAVTLINLLSF